MDDINQGYEDRYIEDQDWHDDKDSDYPKTVETDKNKSFKPTVYWIIPTPY